MELAKQFISKDQTVEGKTVQDVKDFNSQSLATQAEKVDQLIFLMQAVKKDFDRMGDDIVKVSTENASLKKR